MVDNSGIFEELRAESEELEKRIREAKDITKEEVILSAAPFFSLEEKEGKLMITGIALAEGIWKNVFYPADEIQKAADRLVGKPLKVEHGQDSLFLARDVGKVTKAYYDKTLKSIVFQAEVTDPEAIKLVKNGTFPAVSCSTWIDKFPINEEQSIGFNFLFNELSLVRNPACEKCFIFAVEELSKQLNQGKKEDLNIESSQVTTTEVKDMSEEKEEIIAELEEEEIDLSEIEKPKMYAVVEADSLADFDAELAKKIVSYYYGYGYPYPYGKKYPYPHYPYYPYYPYYGKPKGKVKKPEKKSLYALFEVESPEEVEALRKKGKKVVAVYYGYYGYPHYGYPYYGKGNYPYYGYPYYGYPEKKRTKKGLAITEEGEEIEFDTEDELAELKKAKKIVAYYYGYPGYGYPGYGYYPYYGYPYSEYYPYYGYPYGRYPKKMGVALVEENGQDFAMEVAEEDLEELKKKKKVKGYYPYYGYPEKKSEEVKNSTEISDTEIDELVDALPLASDYIDFMKKCMKESKTMPVVKRMKECAEAYKKQKEEKAKKKEECPAGQVWDEKEQKCVPVEGKEKYPAPASAASVTAPSGGREFTDMKPGERITSPPGPDEQAKALAEKVKMSAETVKKEEPQSTATEEKKMTEKPCEECPKEEKKPAEPPKEEAKKEEPKKEVPPKTEVPKEETKPTEVKKEEPKVETPKEPPKEEKKEPSEEEVYAYLKEHWAEVLHKLAKEKKF